MDSCYYCKTPADLVMNNRAMVCPTCNDVKGALSLQDFDTHAFLAFKAGQYTLEQFKNVSASIKELITKRRQLSAKKAQVTRIANSTGWRERYRVAYKELEGKEPTEYPVATETNGIQDFIETFIKGSGGYATRIGNEGRIRKDDDGNYFRIKGLNNGIADIDAGYPGIGAIKIEVKNKFRKDKWKEYYTSGKYKGQKTKQAQYRDTVVAGGAIHYIATDIDSFLVWWDRDILNQR